MISSSKMVRTLGVLGVVTGLAASAAPASALTAMPIPDASAVPAVTLVSGGCGVRFHRTVYGYCRPNVVRYYGGWRGGWGWHRGWGWRGGWHRGGWGWRRGLRRG